MKQFTIATTTVLLLASTARAAPEVEFSLQGGPDAATLDHELRVNRYGFTGGVASRLRWFLSERFSLAGQLNLLYTPRGAGIAFNGVSQGSLRQHYLDIMFAVRPEISLSQWSGYLLLGGGLNVLVRANDENAAGLSQDVTSNLRRLDVALLVGAGVAWHFSTCGLGSFRMGDVFLEARHDQGLIDIDPKNGGFKNRTNSLMLGLSLVVAGPPPPAPATAK